MRALAYFLASGLQGILSIASLPLVTRILGPADYGLYALLTSLVLVAVAVADLGLSVLLAEHYAIADEKQRRTLVTSALVTSWAVAVIFCLAFVISWPAVSGLILEDPLAVPSLLVWLTAVTIPFRSVSSGAAQVFMVSDQVPAAAMLIVMQAVGTFGATLIALFVFDVGVAALFIGGAVGAMASAIIAVGSLKPMLGLHYQGRWMVQLFRIAPAATAAAVGETLRSATENALITRFLGPVPLGLFSHAKTYYAILMQSTNAVAYVLWPKALQEAREQQDFGIVGRVWRTVHFWLVVVGVALACFGIEIVELLTNGKFLGAAVWIPLLVAYLLIQNSGKAATALLYANGRGISVAHLRLLTLVPGLLALSILVPRFGIGGAVAALFAEMIAFRVLIGIAARRLHAVPFQDEWVLIGTPLLITVTIVIGALHMDRGARALLLAALLAILCLAGRRELLDSVRQVKSLVHDERRTAT